MSNSSNISSENPACLVANSDQMPPTASSKLTNAAIAHASHGGAKRHLLRDHLSAVGDLAAKFSKPFDAQYWGQLAGRWHDLGKYANDFQAMIRSATGIDAHIETLPGRIDHSSAGAVLARQLFGQPLGDALSAVIAGHHCGLADFSDLDVRLQNKASRLGLATLNGEAERDGLLAAERPVPPHFLRALRGPEQKLSFELWIRMLFSALIDADSLDTEAFHHPERPAQRAGNREIEMLAERLDSYLEELRSDRRGTVADLRREIQQVARDASQQSTGFFTLTVPTGGGKTFASAVFALHHASLHGLRRLILIPPYTSIIEQTAEALGRALGREAVLEHHSALDPQHETPWTLLAGENWDAPIVVSTAVQFFESLFANRRNRCRKLHNIARSVIVLDEAQTLPAAFLAPILDVLRALVRDYGCSVVFCTATQPALARRPAFPIGLEGLREIAPDPEGAARRLHRVDVVWPSELDVPVTWEILASRIGLRPQALAIVHRKDDARMLTEAVDSATGSSDAICLTTNLCAAHRSLALQTIRGRLSRGEAVRVISTQLIEAGVDVDFPVVFRALGGLDSLAQAAGRCNREGGRPVGLLEVFVAPSEPPPGTPLRGLQEARGMLRANPNLDLFAPATFDEFFRRLFFASTFDQKGVQALREEYRFQAVADAFQLIEDGVTIVVPFENAHELVWDLRRRGPDRNKLRALQRYTVNVPYWRAQKLAAAGATESVADVVTVLTETHQYLYSPRFGLQLSGSLADDVSTLII